MRSSHVDKDAAGPRHGARGRERAGPFCSASSDGGDHARWRWLADKADSSPMGAPHHSSKTRGNVALRLGTARRCSTLLNTSRGDGVGGADRVENSFCLALGQTVALGNKTRDPAEVEGRDFSGDGMTNLF